MADRPIIFSGPMVRALLDGRKTQTRRVLKPTRKITRLGYTSPLLRLDVLDGMLWWWDGIHECVGASQAYPYAPGDRLWVREAVCWVSGWGWRYRADNDDLSEKREAGEVSRWRPSIHMPRWASRLTLTVTDVRGQRLQDISEADAMAEGCEHDSDGWRDYQLPATQCCGTSRDSYRTLWNSLHGPDAWDANPWVVALTFTVQRRNIDELQA